MTARRSDFDVASRTVGLLRLLVLIGAATLVAGFFFAPQRIWPDFLLGSFALLTLGLAGIFFVALQYVTDATWSVALRRVPEAMTAVLPVGALGLMAVLIVRPSLYPWLGRTWAGEGFARFKQVWLSQPFFTARSAVYILAWLGFALAIVANSRRQDSTGVLALTRRNVRLSAAFVVIFGVTFWLASYDWIMSLEPRWYSTIFGVYNFAGLFSAGLAVIAILVVWLRKAAGLEHSLTRRHLGDLGTLLFAFCTFWMYIWFCQYLLIWYANFPEETAYFTRRIASGWGILIVFDLLLNWVVPFLVLMPRANKENPRVLAGASIVVLLGRALDLYLMVLPPFVGSEPVFGVWEAGILCGVVGVFVLVVLRALRAAPLVPIGDPFLYESLHEHG